MCWQIFRSRRDGEEESFSLRPGGVAHDVHDPPLPATPEIRRERREAEADVVMETEEIFPSQEDESG